MRLAANVLAFILAVGAVGCRTKLDKSLSYDTSEGYTKSVTIDAIKNEQQVKITGTTTGGPVDVFVYLTKDKKDADRDIISKKFGAKILAKQLKTDKVDLQVTIPANEEADVRIDRAGAPAKAQLRITNE
jgi:hypothetical protein